MRAVSDTQILEMVLKLARLEGIYAEPASVVGLVGLEQLVAEGTLDPSDTVVAIVTGSGLKSTETIRNYLKTRGP
jgi:threonine synthase